MTKYPLFIFLTSWIASVSYTQSPGVDALEGQGSPLRWNDSVGLWTGGFNAVCTSADWDRDGHVDLMVHYEVGGGAKNTLWGTYLYRNTGKQESSKTHRFEKPRRMNFDGVPLAYDWNHDGLMDCTAGGTLYLNQGNLQFQPAATLDIPPNLTCITDWNHDSLPDLFCSERLDEHIHPTENMSPKGTPPYTPDGIWKGSADRRSIRFYKGIHAVNNTIQWQDEGLLHVNNQPIEVYGGGHASAGDWDLDGDLDLLVGTQTELIYYQNTGSAPEPILVRGMPVQIGSRMDVPGLFLRPTAYQPDPNHPPQLFLAQEDGNVTYLPFLEMDGRGVPKFAKEQRLLQENALVDAGCLAVISVMDWDGDKDLDIVSGNSYGDVLLFENSGTRDKPEMKSLKHIESGNRPIQIKAGANGSVQGPGEAHFGYTCPVAIDWNHDTIMDLILSDVWGNHAYYFGSPLGGSLLEPEAIKVTGRDTSSYLPGWVWWQPRFGELVTQWRCQPAVVDWNVDSTYDIVTIDREGYLAFFLADKSYPTPLLNQPYRAFLYENGEPIRITNGVNGKSGRARIVFADWDGDHDLDIIRGCTNAGDHITPNGQNDERVAVWYENTNDDLHFIYRSNLIGDESVSFAGHATSPAIVDWDNDGKNDLLLGTEDGLIYYFNREYIETTFRY